MFIFSNNNKVYSRYIWYNRIEVKLVKRVAIPSMESNLDFL
jgi:hypothetical protein